MAQDPAAVAKTWLDREDSACSRDRRTRLEWVATLTPLSEVPTFPGGWVAKYLFEEARYWFVYGQFMAAVVVGMAFIERTLAAELCAAGRNDLERASITAVLREGRDAGWLTNAEDEQLDEIRTLRNPVTHSRAPLSLDSVEHRSVATSQLPCDILDEDARKVMVAVFHLLAKNAV